MANVQILKFCSFYSERSARGSDKVWGVAQIENTLVTFWGRRGATLRFKTQEKTTNNYVHLMQQFAERTSPARNGDSYTACSNPAMIERLCPDLAVQISSDYYRGMSRGTLNTMKKAA
jgi:predicted DNA-binding WGR domain protein